MGHLISIVSCKLIIARKRTDSLLAKEKKSEKPNWK